MYGNEGADKVAETWCDGKAAADTPPRRYGVANFWCRMSGGMVGEADWIQPQWEIGVSVLLAGKLQRLFPGRPESLISEAGLSYLQGLPHREWS